MQTPRDPVPASEIRAIPTAHLPGMVELQLGHRDILVHADEVPAIVQALLPWVPAWSAAVLRRLLL